MDSYYEPERFSFLLFFFPFELFCITPNVGVQTSGFRQPRNGVSYLEISGFFKG